MSEKSSEQEPRADSRNTLKTIHSLYSLVLAPLVGVFSILRLTEKSFDWSAILKHWIAVYARFVDFMWGWLPFHISYVGKTCFTLYVLFVLPITLRLMVATIAKRGMDNSWAGAVLITDLQFLVAVYFVDTIPPQEPVPGFANWLLTGNILLYAVFAVYAALQLGVNYMVASRVPGVMHDYIRQVGVTVILMVLLVIFGVQWKFVDA